MNVGYVANVTVSGKRLRLRSESGRDDIQAIVTDLDRDDDLYTEWAADFEDGKKKAEAYVKRQFGVEPEAAWTEYIT